METQPGGAKEIMNNLSFRLAVLLPAAAAAIGLVMTPLRAQAPSVPALTPAAPAFSLGTDASPPACIVPPRGARFDRPLARLSRRLAAGKAIKIVALGSSSTA